MHMWSWNVFTEIHDMERSNWLMFTYRLVSFWVVLGLVPLFEPTCKSCSNKNGWLKIYNQNRWLYKWRLKASLANYPWLLATFTFVRASFFSLGFSNFSASSHWISTLLSFGREFSLSSFMLKILLWPAVEFHLIPKPCVLLLAT